MHVLSLFCILVSAMVENHGAASSVATTSQSVLEEAEL